MDCQSVFSNKSVPGLDASKGERILKAFQKLQKKIQHETSKSLKNKKDITVTDVQLRLLMIQLQYMRGIVNGTIPSKESESSKSNKSISAEDCAEQNLEKLQNYGSKETQTGNSLSCSHLKENELTNTNADSDEETNVEKCSSGGNGVFAPEENQVQKWETVSKVGSSQTQRTSTLSFKQHYHFKFSDLPFILGTAYDSKNRYANYQEMAAMLKNHHRFLCRPQEKCQISTCSGAMSTRVSSHDTKALEGENQTLKHMQADELNAKLNYGNECESASSTKSKPVESFKKQVLQNPNYVTPVHKQFVKPAKSKKTNRNEKHAVPANLMVNNLPQVSRYRNFLSVQELKRSLSRDALS